MLLLLQQLLDLVLEICLLDRIHQLLAFIDDRVTLLFLEHELDSLLVFLGLVVLAAQFERLRQLLGQTADQSI